MASSQWNYYSVFALGLSLPVLTLASYCARRAFKYFDEVVDLTGKTVLITNADNDLGKALSLEFAKRNARVIMACRSIIDGGNARLDVVAKSGHNDRNVLARSIDLSSAEGARDFAQLLDVFEDRLDIIVNNPSTTGFPSPKREVTEFYQDNFFGYFLLTLLLLDKMKESGQGGRILNIGPFAFENALSNHSKLANTEPWGEIIKFRSRSHLYNNLRIMKATFTSDLARRVAGDGITVSCVDPGQGGWTNCQAVLHCALSRKLKNATGRFYRGWQEVEARDDALNTEACRQFRQFCEAFTGYAATPHDESTV